MKWYKDDQQVQPNTDSRVRMDTDVKEDLKVMIIDKATRDDEGTYRLEVTNDSGSVSLNVMVTVDEGRREPKEPKIEIAPEPVEFTEGETITLKCKVSGKVTYFHRFLFIPCRLARRNLDLCCKSCPYIVHGVVVITLLSQISFSSYLPK